MTDLRVFGSGSGGGGSGGRISPTWVPVTGTRTTSYFFTMVAPGGAARQRCGAMTAKATRCRATAVGCVTEAGFDRDGIETHYVCRRHYDRQPRGWW